jgi:hypothetical protein
MFFFSQTFGDHKFCALEPQRRNRSEGLFRYRAFPAVEILPVLLKPDASK